MSFAKKWVLQGACPQNRCLRQAHSLMQFVHACVMAGRIFFGEKRLQRPCPNKQQQTGACVTCNVHRFRCPLLIRGCPPLSFTALSSPALRSTAARPCNLQHFRCPLLGTWLPGRPVSQDECAQRNMPWVSQRSHVDLTSNGTR